MRTPKIEALHRLIDWLNARSPSSQLTKLGLDTSPLGNNPWLSGFIESDGNFYSSFSINSKGIAEVLRHYMRISQKALYSQNSDISKENNSNRQIMEKIGEFLDVKSINEIVRTRDNYVETSYEVRTSKKSSLPLHLRRRGSSSGCEKLINYLDEYPLFSSKHQDFLD
jgi:hypothetical protein